MVIKSIESTDIQQITSGQVIVDIVSIVKELVENSLDAGSAKVEIILNNYGLDSIEVIDDGRGIEKEDFEKLCLKHNTSKIESFEDLNRVDTLGFRGEALSSLAAICDLKITTCTKNDYPRATELTFDKMGKLVGSKIKIGGARGTAVRVSNLFRNLPVRAKNLQKNSKREYGSAINFLTNYLIIFTNVRFSIYNVTKAGKKNLVLGTRGTSNTTIIDNMISIFGSNGGYGLIPIDLKVEDMDVKFKLNPLDFSTTRKFSIRFEGYISNFSFGLGRSATDRQFLFINKRPVHLKRLLKTVNEVYKSFNHIQYPVVVINIDIGREFLDVNVTPDKRTVIMQNEDLINDVLREKLSNFFADQQLHIPRNHRSKLEKAEANEITDSRERSANEAPRVTSVEKVVDRDQGQTSWQRGAKESGKPKKVASVDISEDSDEESSNVEEDKSCVNVSNDVELQVSDKECTGISTASSRSPQPLSHVKIIMKKGASAHNTIRQPHIDKTLVQEYDKTDLPDIFKRYKDTETLFVPGEIDDNDGPHSEFRGKKGTQQHPNEDKPQSISNTSSLEKGASGSEQEEYVEGNDQANVIESAAESRKSKNVQDEGQRDPDSEPEDENVDTAAAILDKEDDDTVNAISKKAIELPQYAAKPTIFNGESRAELHGEPLLEDPHSKKRRLDDNKEEFILKKKDNNKRYHVHNIISSYKVDLESIGRNLRSVSKLVCEQNERAPKVDLDGIEEKEKAEERLSYIISKRDFGRMQVIGQFNLGFIMVTLSSNNLFIIDQHASDEKYNFERLTQSVQLQSQPLVVPQTMDLNVIDELTVVDNMHVFKNNGFGIRFMEESAPGRRILLVSLPMSRNAVFDLNDFQELIHLINVDNSVSNKHIKCSKVRSLLAMRACRGSIMVGQHLNRPTMQKVVSNLSTLDKPWNCPHGRPTMRHLIELKNWPRKNFDYRLS